MYMVSTCLCRLAAARNSGHYFRPVEIGGLRAKGSFVRNADYLMVAASGSMAAA